ncbi:hypothetical protein GCM10022251_64650 [Phytohabitans flavus]|uniref:Uncharacterized protein n=1 Tax=Phytohabitans flavus TaxID=1076124 RepID=A0A6F8XU33_9ACTN|nr:hypothetical protein Pflav_037540 [Phytohabitans flavus]
MRRNPLSAQDPPQATPLGALPSPGPLSPNAKKKRNRNPKPNRGRTTSTPIMIQTKSLILLPPTTVEAGKTGILLPPGPWEGCAHASAPTDASRVGRVLEGNGASAREPSPALLPGQA